MSWVSWAVKISVMVELVRSQIRTECNCQKAMDSFDCVPNDKLCLEPFTKLSSPRIPRWLMSFPITLTKHQITIQPIYSENLSRKNLPTQGHAIFIVFIHSGDASKTSWMKAMISWWCLNSLPGISPRKSHFRRAAWCGPWGSRGRVPPCPSRGRRRRSTWQPCGPGLRRPTCRGRSTRQACSSRARSEAGSDVPGTKPRSTSCTWARRSPRPKCREEPEMKYRFRRV